MREYGEQNCLSNNGAYDVDVMTDLLYRNVVSRKKISRVDTKCEEYLKYFIQMVNDINLMDEYDSDYQGYNFDQVLIPSFMKQFVRPMKISLDSSNWCEDLKVYYDTEDFEYLPDKVMDYTEILYGTQKLAGAYDKLSAFREVKLVKDSVWTCWDGNEWRMHVESDSFNWATPVNETMFNLYRNSYFNESCNYIMFHNIIRWGLGEKKS